MLTDFVGNKKQQMFYQLWKSKLDTLIINNVIIKYILYGMVTRYSLRWVPLRSTTSLFSHVTLNFLLHFRSGTQMSNTNFNNLFYMIIKFDKLLAEWNWQFFTKRRIKINQVSIIAQSVQFFLLSRNATKQRNVTT